MVGFCETLRIEAGAPLVSGCRLLCSGGDAALALASSAPDFRGCSLSGRGAGLRVAGAARVKLSGCRLEDCGGPALRLQQRGAAALTNTLLARSGAEGVAADGDSAATLRGCRIEGCGGPGIDASGCARVDAARCVVQGSAGGAWAWEHAALCLERCALDGGADSGFALLLDGGATLERLGDCRLDARAIFAATAAAAAALAAALGTPPPEGPGTSRFPPERGAFGMPSTDPLAGA
jgi:hypothetical protein